MLRMGQLGCPIRQILYWWCLTCDHWTVKYTKLTQSHIAFSRGAIFLLAFYIVDCLDYALHDLFYAKRKITETTKPLVHFWFVYKFLQNIIGFKENICKLLSNIFRWKYSFRIMANTASLICSNNCFFVCIKNCMLQNRLCDISYLNRNAANGSPLAPPTSERKINGPMFANMFYAFMFSIICLPRSHVPYNLFS